jgi:hypothetical protein
MGLEHAMNRNWRTWAFTGLVSVIGGLLPAAFSPASAQDIVPQRRNDEGS